MLAKLLAAILQPPRFAGARRKQSDKTGNVGRYSGEIHTHPLEEQQVVPWLLTPHAVHL